MTDQSREPKIGDRIKESEPRAKWPVSMVITNNKSLDLAKELIKSGRWVLVETKEE